MDVEGVETVSKAVGSAALAHPHLQRLTVAETIDGLTTSGKGRGVSTGTVIEALALNRLAVRPTRTGKVSQRAATRAIEEVYGISLEQRHSDVSRIAFEGEYRLPPDQESTGPRITYLTEADRATLQAHWKAEEAMVRLDPVAVGEDPRIGRYWGSAFPGVLTDRGQGRRYPLRRPLVQSLDDRKAARHQRAKAEGRFRGVKHSPLQVRPLWFHQLKRIESPPFVVLGEGP